MGVAGGGGSLAPSGEDLLDGAESTESSLICAFLAHLNKYIDVIIKLITTQSLPTPTRKVPSGNAVIGKRGGSCSYRFI